jgi:hypothetical protein
MNKQMTTYIKINVCFCPQRRMSPPVPQTVVKGKQYIYVTNKIKLQWITKKLDQVLKQRLQVLFHIVYVVVHITRKLWSPKFCGSYAPLNLKISRNIPLKQLVSATPLKLRNTLLPTKFHEILFCSVVSEELCWQAASVVNFGKFLCSKGQTW